MKKSHHYLDPVSGTPLKIVAYRTPSEKSKPKSGTWVVREFDVASGAWLTPPFPEIKWSSLKKMIYLGSTK